MEDRASQEDSQKERNEENTEIREMGTLDLGNGHSRHGIQLLTIIGETTAVGRPVAAVRVTASHSRSETSAITR